MKVLILATHFRKGGAEKQLGYIATELARNGAKVLHLSIAEQAMPEGAKTEGLRFQSLGIKHFRSPVLLKRFFSLCRKERPQIILSCVHLCNVLAYLWTRASRCKWVMREPNTFVEAKQERSWALNRHLGRSADRLIANNQGGYDYWKTKRDGRPTHLIPNLTYVDQVRAAANQVSAYAMPNQPYFIGIGRMQAQKNFSQAIRGFARLAKSYDDVQLCLVGSGSLKPELEALSQSLGVVDRVVFTGYLENPLPLLRGAQGLILPSLFEGCPNVAMEAVILGIPPLLSDIPAHRALFDEKSALFFQLHDPLDTIRALHDCLDGWKAGGDSEQLIDDWSSTTNGVHYFRILEESLQA